MIPIVYAGNKKIFDGILISVISLVKNTDSPLDIYLFTMDFTEKNENFLPLDENQRQFLEKICKEKNADSKVTIIDVGELYKASLINSPNAVTSYTPYSFLRLFAHRVDLLPSKIIYLDADTIVNKDINELYNIDIENYELAGVLDYYGKIFMGINYINSGVLLLNLDKIRETRLFDKVIDRLNEKRLFLPDQTAINRLVKNKLIIPRKFNEQKSYKKDPVIQHFTKMIKWLPYFHTVTIKPWNVDTVKAKLTRKYDGILDKYLELKEIFEREYATK